MSPVPPISGGGGGGGGGDADSLQGQNGAYYRARSSHTGTQPASTVSDFSAAAVAAVLAADGSGSGLDADLLDGVSGAAYLARANQTGTQPASTISDFNAAADARAALAAAALVDSAPGTLDTLNELAAALGDDPNFATTTAASIGAAQSDADAAQATADNHIADAVAAHDSSAIAYDNSGSGLTAANVQDAIDEIEAEVGSAGVALSDNNVWTGTNQFDNGATVYHSVETLEGSSAAATVQVTGITGELPSYARHSRNADGTMEWGGGAASPDVSLGRVAANVLALGTGDKLQQDAAPTVGDDVTNKTYVDGHISDATDAHAASAIGLTPTGDVAATTVQAGIAELAAEKATAASVTAVQTSVSDHLADPTDAHAGTAITNTPSGTVAATTVQAAINELDSEKATTGSVATVQSNLTTHTSAPAGAHAGTAISNTPAGNVAATTVQAAINELDSEKATTGSVTTVQANVDAHINDTTDAHAGTAITNVPAGGVAATTVQSAINELDTEKATTAALTAHTGAVAGAHAASAISSSATGDVAATDVQSAIAELASEKATTGSVTTVQTNLTTHINNAAGAHAATAVSFSPTGTVSSTTVQAAIAEIDGDVTALSGSFVPAVKFPCRVASTANINLASAPATVDTIALVNGDRVFAKDQTTGSQKGIYIFNGVGVAMTRATDLDADSEAPYSGFFVPVQEGDKNATSVWQNFNSGPITIGTTSLAFTRSMMGNGVNANTLLTQQFYAGLLQIFTSTNLEVRNGSVINLDVSASQTTMGNTTSRTPVAVRGKIIEDTQLVTATKTLSTTDRRIQYVDTTGGVVTVNLPATPTDGEKFIIVDAGAAGAGNALVNNITIGRNGKNINGAAANLTMATNRQRIELVYLDSTRQWVVLNNQTV